VILRGSDGVGGYSSGLWPDNWLYDLAQIRQIATLFTCKFKGLMTVHQLFRRTWSGRRFAAWSDTVAVKVECSTQESISHAPTVHVAQKRDLDFGRCTAPPRRFESCNRAAAVAVPDHPALLSTARR